MGAGGLTNRVRHTLTVLRHRVWPELRQAWPFGLFVAGPVGATVMGIVTVRAFGASAADGVRYFGTLLQLFGLILVALGLRSLRHEFGRPPVLTAMRARAVAIFQSFKPRHHTLSAGTGHISIGGVAAMLAVGSVRGSVEQRLDHLERAISELRKQAADRQQKVDGELATLREEMAKETKARADGHAEITRKLGTIALDDHYLDVVGLWWLLFATVATSVPDEIAALWSALVP